MSESNRPSRSARRGPFVRTVVGVEAENELITQLTGYSGGYPTQLAPDESNDSEISSTDSTGYNGVHVTDSEISSTDSTVNNGVHVIDTDID